MAINRDKKSAIIAKLADIFTKATSVAFIGFTKLTVKDAFELRKTLRDVGVQYYVAKKTLIKKALHESGYTEGAPDLPGEVAIAWTTDDVTAPARGVYEFGKKLKGALTLLGGVFEGGFVDALKMQSIATIPPLSVLRSMFVTIIHSPRQRFAVALGEVAKLKH